MNIRFDRVAVNVRSIAPSVEWYRSTIGAKVLYQEETRAFLKKAKTHRDGTVSHDVVDPDGNAIECIYIPETAPEAVHRRHPDDESEETLR
jgi:catechol 2,3-dioxygenase-like lactoylglutathione lyase family enzyme